MTREKKAQAIEDLKEILTDNSTIYLADLSELNAAQSSELRRACFKNGLKLKVVKNTLLKKAMETSGKEFDELYDTLKGNTSIITAEKANVPARVIKEFRKKADKPVLKGAWIQEDCYVGDEQLEILASIKSKEELIGDLVGLLQSPMKNILSALQSGGSTISGLVKTLSEKS